MNLDPLFRTLASGSSDMYRISHGAVVFIMQAAQLALTEREREKESENVTHTETIDHSAHKSWSGCNKETE